MSLILPSRAPALWLAAGASTLALLAAGGAVAGQPFAPLGVMLNQDTGIGTAQALGITDSTQFTLSFWAMGTLDDTHGNNNTQMTSGDFLAGHNNTWCEVNGPGNGPAPGECISFDTSPSKAQMSFNNSTGLSTATDKVLTSGLPADAASNFQNGQWNYYLISGNTATGNLAVVENGVNVTGTKFANNVIDHNVIPDFNSGGFKLINGSLGGNAGKEFGYASEVWLSTQTSMVCTGAATISVGGNSYACGAANTIPQALINKFDN
ncbi:MAG: hypothetical protein JOZ27_02610, partial [Caulobacteraceae bacterium]|nr:hypothetical protein [Caulobacteraceae bacterium]